MGVQADARQRFKKVGEGLDRHPMQLNILPYRDVGNPVSVAMGKVGNRSQLFRTQQTVGDPDSHHETLQRRPFPALAAGNASPIALGVDAPPAKVGSNPLRRNRSETFARKAPDFVQAFPRVLERLRRSTLCALVSFAVFVISLFRPRLPFAENKKPTARSIWRWVFIAATQKTLSWQPPRARAHACTTTTRAHAQRG
jgi:hypothetical protein